MSWDDDRVNMLIDLWQQGMSAATVANRLNVAYEMGITRSAVIGKIHRLGMSGRTRRTRARPTGPEKKQSRVPVPAITTPNYRQRPLRMVPDIPSIPDEIAAAYDAARLLHRKSLVDLDDRECKWPIGDPRTDEFGFCAAKRIPGTPYCTHHNTRAAPHISSRRPAVNDNPPSVVRTKETADA